MVSVKVVVSVVDTVSVVISCRWQGEEAGH